MGLPWIQTISATGAAVPYAADYMQSPGDWTWSVDGIAGGVTGTYDIEVTADDLNGTPAPVWMSLFGAGSQAANGIGAQHMNVRGIRINVATLAGGTIRFTVLQGMSSR